jgi:hypothetical protein
VSMLSPYLTRPPYLMLSRNGHVSKCASYAPRGTHIPQCSFGQSLVLQITSCSDVPSSGPSCRLIRLCGVVLGFRVWGLGVRCPLFRSLLCRLIRLRGWIIFYTLLSCAFHGLRFLMHASYIFGLGFRVRDPACSCTSSSRV